MAGYYQALSEVRPSSECAVSCFVDTSSMLINHEQQELNSNLNKLWDLDIIGNRTGDDVYFNVIDDIQFTGERYTVGLPWKVAHRSLPSNYSASLARLRTSQLSSKDTGNL